MEHDAPGIGTSAISNAGDPWPSSAIPINSSPSPQGESPKPVRPDWPVRRKIQFEGDGGHQLAAALDMTDAAAAIA